MREERGAWYLITGLIIGVVIGLIVAWRIAPVKYVDTSPATLMKDFKDRYRAMIAAAYVADGDLARAKARLNLLKDADAAKALALHAQQALAEGRPADEARALGLLAIALSQDKTALGIEDKTGTSVSDLSTPIGSPTTGMPPVQTEAQSSTFTPAVGLASATPWATTPPAPTPIQGTPLATFTPLPSRTPTPTPGAPFVLQGKPTLVCDPALKQPLIMVEARDAAGAPVPGVEVIVNWSAGEDHFFTGLKPEMGLGYADYLMSPGITYMVHLAEGGEPVPDLAARECEATSGERYWGSWKLIFVQP